jgi:hypothetical protein
MVSSGRYSGQEKSTLARLANQATRDIDALRMTPEIEQAETGVKEAMDAFVSKRAELRQVGETMDGGNPDNVFSTSPYTKALRKVQIDRAGRVTILADDDPDYTGVSIPKVENE